jgi:hypothetical protein
MTTTAAQMTSATYLPAGCKPYVKLNLAGAYRTTYTHLVPGDVIRVETSVHHSGVVMPSGTRAANKSFWATVSKVERANRQVFITVESSWFTGRVAWDAPHTAVTRKERATEHSARLMLAEQEREASLKASEAELAAAAAARQEARIQARREATRQPDRPEEYQAASRTSLPAIPFNPAGAAQTASVVAVAESIANGNAAATVSVHTPKLDSNGLCKLVVDRPNGYPTMCMEPVSSAIHDPAAFSAYHAEIMLELKAWSDPADLDRVLETAFPSIPVQRQPEGEEVLARSGARVHLRASWPQKLTRCGLDVSGPANGYDGPPCTNCAQVSVPAPKAVHPAEAKLDLMRSTMTNLVAEARRRAANWVPEHQLTTMELEAKADLLDVLLRLLDS